MQCVADGDDGAFRRLYDGYASLLFSVIFHILKDAKEAEDALQETFLQIWKKAGAYNATRGSISTWAVMIARCKAIDKLRSRGRYCLAMEAAALDETFGNGEYAEAESDRLSLDGDECEQVRTAVQRMDRHQREAIHLAFFSGLTHVEIAEHLNAPLGTIKARIRRGLLSLRTALAEERSLDHAMIQSRPKELPLLPGVSLGLG
jgi:RNA polymerase sigma-70 factor (ECF subfamily)